MNNSKTLPFSKVHGVSAELAELMDMIPTYGYVQVPVDQPGFYVGMCSFSPEVAAYILTHRNKFNRPKINQQNVATLIESISSGEWMVTGETIIFDINGQLRNGQHRLIAVRECETEITSLTVFGSNPESFAVMDRGANRSLGDNLKIFHKIKANQQTVASVLLALYEFLNTGKVHAHNSSRGVPQNRLLDFFKLHPGIDDSTSAIPARQMWKGQGTTAVLCHYLFGVANLTLRNEFFRCAIETTWGNDPSLSGLRALQRKMESVEKTNTRAKATYSRNDWMAYMIKAWNHFVSGGRTEMQQLKMGSDESFPKINGIVYDSHGIPCDHRLPRIITE